MDSIDSLVATLPWSRIAIAFILYFPTLAVYRLFFHPLAGVPGPKLAAISRYFEAYYDVVKPGQYTFKIAEMHKKYGNPHELHIHDPSFFDQLYSYDGRWNKYDWAVDAAGAPLSTICSIDHTAHKRRRYAVSTFFSRSNVASRQDVVRRQVSKLCDRINEFSGTTVPLGDAVPAFTRDVAEEFVLEKRYDNLGQRDFHVDLSKFSQTSGSFWRFSKHVRWFSPLMNSLPLSFIEKISDKPAQAYFAYMKGMKKIVRDLIEDAANNPHSERTVVHHILRSNLPPLEKSTDRIYDEVFTLMSAGYVSTAHCLRIILYHIYSDQEVLARLRSELADARQNKETSQSLAGELSLSTLEQLDYLTAVITEGLRLGPALASRSARVSPDRPLVYGKWQIPAGTPVGMTTILLHMDHSSYPNPQGFNPDRWMPRDEPQRSDRIFAPFSRGTRICLGMNLAWAELYIAISSLVEQFDFEFDEALTPGHFECISDEFVIGTRSLDGMKALVTTYGVN